MGQNMTELPNEIIYQIILCVPPASVSVVQRVCHRFNDLSQPILWRQHCRNQFEYWSSDHGIHEKFAGPVAKVDWQSIFCVRHRKDRETTRGLDSILATQTGRIEKTEKLIQNGYDVKETLTRHLHTSDDAEDVLARRFVPLRVKITGVLKVLRRFYSDALLGNLHRRLGIREWIRLESGESVSLERALAAFDMFILHDRKGDFDEVCFKILVKSVMMFANSRRSRSFLTKLPIAYAKLIPISKNNRRVEKLQHLPLIC